MRWMTVFPWEYLAGRRVLTRACRDRALRHREVLMPPRCLAFWAIVKPLEEGGGRKNFFSSPYLIEISGANQPFTQASIQVVSLAR